MKPIDSHAHIDSEDFDIDRDQVIDRIKENMDLVVNIGCNIESSKMSIKYAEKYDFFYATVGIHPMEIKEYNEKAETELIQMAKSTKVVAIGEIGLDYHWMTDPKEVQIQGFVKQMAIAEQLNKPVVIHTREALDDTMEILKKFPKVTGIVHCFPWSADIALQIPNDYYFGIGGVLTFKNSKKLVQVVEKLPLDRLILETDCPYMAPEPLRGTRNEPCNVKYVAQKIADIKGISYDTVIKVTNENTRKAYHI